MPEATARIAKKRVPELAAGAITLILALTGWLGMRYVGQVSEVQHTLEVQTKIAEIWSSLQDVEISQRSFLLTGDENLLIPFREAAKEIPGAVENLSRLVSDNPQQVNAIAQAGPLISDRLAFANRMIDLFRQRGFEVARDEIRRGDGLRIMQDLRTRFDRMYETETQLLSMRQQSTRKTTIALFLAIGGLLLGTFGALGAWIHNFRRLSMELAESNASLREQIAERAAAELQIRQMQKMEAVGQLTGGIAHDFNNMLAIIMSGISLAQRRMKAGREGADQFLSGALEGAQRASTLVKRLLAFSRQQPLAPVPIDANKFVSGLSELIARAIGESIRMETILGAGLWLTHADSAQLENAILNLCVNSRDAMPDGGRLTVETANCHLDDHYSRIHSGVPPGQYVLIAVTDTGTGMPPEVIEKAFEPFFTTKDVSKGTGLGLSQVFGFVKQSGGHVKIYSEPGQGTTVKIYLPRYYGESKDQDTGTATVEELRGTETILLVEDDAAVLSLTATSLRDLGYTVIESKHPSDAIRHISDGAHIDLLLTDIVMPDVNGRKLADEAIAHRPGLKVVFMTGFTRNAVVHNGVLDHDVHFLAKPFTIEELSRKVREALKARRG